MQAECFQLVHENGAQRQRGRENRSEEVDEQRESKVEKSRSDVASASALSDSASASPFGSPSRSRQSKTRLTVKEDLEQQIHILTQQLDAAVQEKASCETQCETRLQEMEQETTALRLLLEEENHRTDTLAEHVEYLGHMLEEPL